MIHNKIEETNGRFLIGQEEERESPHWTALFEGSRPMLVQKTVLSPGKDSTQFISGPGLNGNKKRRAPPPPPDKLPFVQPTVYSCPPSEQEKENSNKGIRSRTGRPSLDAKFSAIIQQLQKSHGPSRKNPPLAQGSHNLYIPVKTDTELNLPEHAEKASTQAPQPPLPAPRNKLGKSFREKMNPKAW